MGQGSMGQGSMLTIHPMSGDIRTPHDVEHTDKRLKQLLFLDLVEQGIYIAERGFMALSLVVGASDTQLLLGALESFIKRYRHLLVASA